MSGGPVILVVDDDEMVRSTVLEELAHSGYRVLEAQDAEQAMAMMMARADIRLLLTDVRMPGTDGLELAALAQGRRPGLRVLVISGYFVPRPAPWRVLRKPFGHDELLAAVRDEIGAGGR